MKTTKEMIEVMQAYERGEQIECLDDGTWKCVKNPVWDWLHTNYRVKSKYVPFDTAEEFLTAQREHGKTVRRKADNHLFRSFVNECGDIALVDAAGHSLNENIGDIYGRYEFLDRTHCGKEVVS